MNRKIIFVFFFLFFASHLIIADDAPVSYKEENFPQWAKDLRRTEIITLGSLPFVTLWTTVIYSYSVYGEFHNPLDKSNSSFTEDDQWKIIQMSAATCVVLGIADLAINLIMRKIEKNKEKTINTANSIEVFKSSQEGFDEIPGIKNEDFIEEAEIPEYFSCGVESAIF